MTDSPKPPAPSPWRRARPSAPPGVPAAPEQTSSAAPPVEPSHATPAAEPSAAPVPVEPVPVAQAFDDRIVEHRRESTAAEHRPATPPPPKKNARVTAAREVSSTGLSPRVAGVLCYAAGWVSGLVLLAMERQSSFVRFHAYQAVMALGGLTLIAMGCWAFTILMAFFSPGAFRVMAVVTQIAWIALGVTWLFAVVEVSQGKRRKLPLVGKRAERVAAALPTDR